ncbi:MAG: hypothetical protein NT055_09090, partial [Nitrospirae bacterium]|nr:hypothetical protein [Nitrospirota bacterium]
PVLVEDKKKEIKTDADKPTHILIESDNYHALSVLNYTHAKSIDVMGSPLGVRSCFLQNRRCPACIQPSLITISPLSQSNIDLSVSAASWSALVLSRVMIWINGGGGGGIRQLLSRMLKYAIWQRTYITFYVVLLKTLEE